jgi:hypothetical protein
VSKFEAEIAIHQNSKDINRRPILVFPELLICLDCGIAQFTVPKTALGALAKGDEAAAVG